MNTRKKNIEFRNANREEACHYWWSQLPLAGCGWIVCLKVPTREICKKIYRRRSVGYIRNYSWSWSSTIFKLQWKVLFLIRHDLRWRILNNSWKNCIQTLKKLTAWKSITHSSFLHTKLPLFAELEFIRQSYSKNNTDNIYFS